MIQLSEQEFVELIMRAAYRVMQDVYHEHQREVEEMQDYVDAINSQKVELERQICSHNAHEPQRCPLTGKAIVNDDRSLQRHKAVIDDNSEGEL